MKVTERLQIPQDGQDDARPQEVAAFIKAASKVLDLGQEPQLQVNALQRSVLCVDETVLCLTELIS